jgi:putative nucleotidyltransferase with HDIG domain
MDQIFNHAKIIDTPMNSILETLQIMNSEGSTPATFFSIINSLNLHLGIDAVSIQRLINKDILVYISGKDFVTDKSCLIEIQESNNLAWQVVKKGKIVHIPNLESAGESDNWDSCFKDESFKSYLGVPLIYRNEVVGVMELFHRRKMNIDADFYRYLLILSGMATLLISSAKMSESSNQAVVKLETAYGITLEAWSTALEIREKTSLGHARRVTELTIQMAAKLKLDDEDLINMTRGSILHDIGKMILPDSILSKKGPLSENEWVLMKKHPEYAYELLKNVSFLKPAMDIVLHHHEHWDGSGYPHGLKREDIPICARVIAVADVYDALTSHRAYRTAWLQENASSYIKEQSGQLFDPDVVKVFEKIINSEYLNAVQQ